MNQDQVKELLVSLDNRTPDFSVIFTGKESKRIDGLYKPKSREILINNRNFRDENQLIYTAIHEFSHHIHFTRYPGEFKRRSHTNHFWSIFHELLDQAESRGLYSNIFVTDPAFVTLTERIQTNFLSRNGQLMKEFGKVLIEALELCGKKHATFEDYIDRVLGMSRTTARSIMKMYALDIDEDFGYDRMKAVATIPKSSTREAASEAFREGKTLAQVRHETSHSERESSRHALKSEKNVPESSEIDSNQPSTIEHLQAQRRSLEKSIADLEKKLQEIDRKIHRVHENRGHGYLFEDIPV